MVVSFGVTEDTLTTVFLAAFRPKAYSECIFSSSLKGHIEGEQASPLFLFSRCTSTSSTKLSQSSRQAKSYTVGPPPIVESPSMSGRGKVSLVTS